jgi:hypothetical protein
VLICVVVVVSAVVVALGGVGEGVVIAETFPELVVDTGLVVLIVVVVVVVLAASVVGVIVVVSGLILTVVELVLDDVVVELTVDAAGVILTVVELVLDDIVVELMVDLIPKSATASRNPTSTNFSGNTINLSVSISVTTSKFVKNRRAAMCSLVMATRRHTSCF